jgi:hypothetical protein
MNDQCSYLHGRFMKIESNMFSVLNVTHLSSWSVPCCLVQPSRITVRGSHDRAKYQHRNVKSLITHENFLNTSKETSTSAQIIQTRPNALLQLVQEPNDDLSWPAAQASSRGR